MNMRVAPGAGRMASVPVIAGMIGAVLATWYVGLVGIALGALVMAFYRDPARTPDGEGIVSPADGTVREIEHTDEGRVRVAIFLNVWHVHVIRAPWDGTVEATARVDGHRRPAFLAGAADNAGIAMDIGPGTVTMRAGVVARRVRAYVDPGTDVVRGERIGHIAFGSRVDVVMPPDVDLDGLAVAPGDRVRAGSSVIATNADGERV